MRKFWKAIIESCALSRIGLYGGPSTVPPLCSFLSVGKEENFLKICLRNKWMVPQAATISSAVVPGIAEHHITAVSASKELVEQNETVCLLFTTTSCMYNNQSCERTNFIWRARWSPYTLDS